MIRKFLIFVAIILVIYSFRDNNSDIKINKIKVDAPFKMPEITIPDFSNCPKFDIVDFGAEKNNKEKTTRAIELAIDAANKAGGGIVIIPEGEWLTGKIHLKSNVNLHISEGAILTFSEYPEDYLPPVHTSWEGLECYNYSPLIYAYKCKNIAITGKGKIVAKIDIWKKWFKRTSAHMQSLKNLYYQSIDNVPVEKRNMVNDSSNLRPHFIHINRCENVIIDGLTIINSPFWTVHLYMSKNIVVRNLNISALGHNNDGIDPEMSQNVLIENCTLNQGDDAISIKSGRDIEAWRLNTPSKNIVIKNVTVLNGHQLVAIGSELSGGIENIFIDSCKVSGNAKLNHLLYIKTNERRGGYVKNIYMTNTFAEKIDSGILGIETDVLYQWRTLTPTIQRKLTDIQNIYLRNINAKNVKFIAKIEGEKEIPVKNVVLENVKADTVLNEKYQLKNVQCFSIINK